MPRLARLFTLLALFASCAGAEVQVWMGKVDLAGIALDVIVRVDMDAAPPSGTLDIPMQGAVGIPLADIEMGDERMAFSVPAIGASVDAARVEAGPEFAGTMSQGGASYDLTIRPLRRPQTPVPPFPYASRDVTFPGGGEGVTLAGTLTIPEGDGPFPGVILVTGSSAQDRDETIFEHRPFAVIADHLTRAGIAVLRYDDRGTAESTGSFVGSTTDDFADDARAALEFLAGQPEADVAKLGVIGHSEGGLIAPLLASEEGTRASFIVMMAGLGVPGDEVMIEQVGALLLAMGGDPEQIPGVRRAHRRVIDAALAEPMDEEAFVMAMRLFLATQASAVGQEVPKGALQGIGPEAAVQFTNPWMKRFLTLDPRDVLRKVEAPVLVLNGNLDRQVIPEQNVPEIIRALREGGNEDVTAHVFPRLNHLFQTAETGSDSEYGEIEQTIAPEVLTMIEEWIRGVVGE